MRCDPAGDDLERAIVKWKRFGIGDSGFNILDSLLRKRNPGMVQDFRSEIACHNPPDIWGKGPRNVTAAGRDIEQPIGWQRLRHLNHSREILAGGMTSALHIRIANGTILCANPRFRFIEFGGGCVCHG